MNAGPSSSWGNLELLKELMLGDEQRALAVLRERLDGLEEESVERLSRDLAAAIRLREELGDAAFDDFAEALRAGTESAIERSVGRDKSRLAAALFPIMGPAIRNYVTALFHQLSEDLNDTIRNTTSLERLRWRAEAKLAGKPFSEYLLLKTRDYRVDEIYWMQRDTGLLLGHARREDPEAVRGGGTDLVSGMLTAIRSFVRDSFGPGNDAAAGGESGELSEFTFGEHEVTIAEGPSTLLAVVSKGGLPTAARDRFAEILERLSRKFRGELDRFAGDVTVFEPARPVLAEGLIENHPDGEPDGGGGMWRLWVVLGAVVAGIAAVAGWSAWETRRWNRFEAALQMEPGIEVTEARRGRWFGAGKIRGLRDPLAADPVVVAKRFGFEKGGDVIFEMAPYQSLESHFVSAREAERDAAFSARWKEHRAEVLAEVAGAFEPVKEAATKTAGGLAETRDEVSEANQRLSAVESRLNAAVEKRLAAARAAFEKGLADTEARHRDEMRALREEWVRAEFAHLPGVRFDFSDAGVKVSGSAPEPDHSRLLARLGGLPALGKVDASALANETRERIESLEGEIRARRVVFPDASRELNETDAATLDAIGVAIRELTGEGEKIGREWRFRIEAHPLIGRQREGNRPIERARAERVRDRLVELGLPADRLRIENREDFAKAGQGVSVVAEPVGQ
ncbi:MAG: hypothetical protein KDM91_01560 [Verrucomicrobiae bacterium]|nr:hypothetical protein [Verrucomicrobiae bacterium]